MKPNLHSAAENQFPERVLSRTLYPLDLCFRPNDFIKRREAVAGPLTRLVDGAPGLLVHPNCLVLRKAMAGGYSYKRVQAGGAAKFRDVPDKNGLSHVAESLQYLLVGGGEARHLVKRPYSGPRSEMAFM